MRYFTTAPGHVFRKLEMQARDNVIISRQLTMPSGCTPDKADIGIEVDGESGRTTLYVGIHHAPQSVEKVCYTGTSQELSQWFRDGEKAFPSFNDLMAFFQGPLREAFAPPPPIVDLEDIRSKLVNEAPPLFQIDAVELEKRLCEKVKGQNHAMKILAHRAAHSCMRTNPSRPAVFCMVGTTGTGKTFASECLAHEISNMSGGSKPYGYLRLDMNEYKEQHRVSQLLGAPVGYVGSDKSPNLIKKLKDNPCMVVLFDEIEKAHSDILDVLMNAMESGRITPGVGDTVDCKAAIFIFTSNLKVDEILEELESRKGFGNNDIEKEVCSKKFKESNIRTEIVGRFQHFLVFRPLPKEVLIEIIGKMIKDCALEYGITVTYVESSVVVELMQIKDDGKFGARPVRDRIQSQFQSVFVKAMCNRHNRCRVVGPPFDYVLAE